ncbi:glycosyltransferase [Sphingobacterium sp.]|uniref:glycosyltransferase n=1 Tax=Sphingobacterium sp. TaxID=341027 RepID=UPI0028B1B17B|nr:glycosyltransferase [Sphingobacterium sp.]
MRVLQVINNLNVGGAEKLLVESLPFYEEMGVDIDLLCLNETDSILNEEVLKNRFKGKFKTITTGTLYNPLLIWKLIPIIRKYDIIHIHLFPALYFVVIANFFCHTKLIYTEHSTYNKRRGNKFLRMIDKFIYSKINKIVSISDDVDLKLKQHLGNKFSNKIIKIENGINLKKFISATPYNKEEFFLKDSFIMMQVSSFRFPKDQMTIIKALKYLPDDVKFICVGDGPLLEANKKVGKELNVDDRLIFLGLRGDVPKLLKTADVIILSSKYEGLSLASIEGMCLNKPFIATDVPGLKDVVKGAGLLFNYQDVNGFSELILKLKDNHSYYNEVSASCFNRAQNFDIKKMIYGYIELYKKLSTNV